MTTSTDELAPPAASAPPVTRSAGLGLMLATLALLAVGMVFVNSAMSRVASRDMPWYNRTENKHIMFVAAGALIIMVGWRMNYRRLWSKHFPWVAAALLCISLLGAGLAHVPGLSHDEGNFKRWIRLGPITIQPSEMIKITVLIFLAAWLTRPGVNPKSFFKTFVPAMIFLGVAVGVTVTESRSTAILIALAGVLTITLAGVPWYYLLVLIPPAAAGFYKLVIQSEYHWKRFAAVTDPWDIENPAAYQARESLIAVLHGGWTGLGLGRGTVKQGFLPEASSDFIFAIICEEIGFIGAILIISLIVLWLWQVRKTAMRSSDAFGYVLAASIGVLMGLQSVLHICVTLAVAPTAGQGLPFISQGGTFLLMSSFAVALLMSVAARGRPAKEPEELTQPATA